MGKILYWFRLVQLIRVMAYQQYRPTNNGYLQKSKYGNALGLDYEESKNNRHLPPSPVGVTQRAGGVTTHRQLVGHDRWGNPIYQLVNWK